jgi:hypothetical protein
MTHLLALLLPLLSPAPVLLATPAASESPVQAPPAKCEVLTPIANDQAALTTAGKAMVARGRKFPIGSPRHTDVKIEMMRLFIRSGDLGMCKQLRATRAKRTLSSPQAHAITCMEQQFCQPMPLANGCPAGLQNQGPEGCAPVRSCTAAGDRQAAACKAGDTSCCAPALLALEIADVQAGWPTPESLATRRTLAKLACDAGHAEVCLEAAALGIGTPEAQRRRACALGHIESCRPPKTAP